MTKHATADLVRQRMGQLERVVYVLEGEGVSCWVDSGTLLGLVRRGALLPWDRDIDISCLVGDRDAATEALQALGSERGYRLQTSRYRGVPFKIELRPPWRSTELKIDLSFWWDRDQTAYSLMVCNMPLRLRRGTPAWWLAQSVRQPMIRLVWPPLRRSRPLEFDALSIRVGVYVWEVPRYMFKELTRLEIEGHTYPVPADWEGYLSYRYGDWRTPRSDWLAPLDDGSARLVLPEAKLPEVFAVTD